MKTKERASARRLRGEGRSIKEVAAMVGVAPSSVSRWVRDIELNDDARARLRARNPAHNGEIVRAANLDRARKRRLSWQLDGRARARSGDRLHHAGCMLYWGEGSRSLCAVQFTNSDPAMVALFVDFLRRAYGADVGAIGLRVSLFADHVERQREIERHWLDVTQLPRSSLRRSIVNQYSRRSGRKRLGRLPHGTCRITLHRAAVVQSIYGAIQEYGGFERPEWLG